MNIYVWWKMCKINVFIASPATGPASKSQSKIEAGGSVIGKLRLDIGGGRWQEDRGANGVAVVLELALDCRDLGLVALP